MAPKQPKAETPAPEPETPEQPEEPEAPEAPEETGTDEEGDASASLTVSDPEEVALLINARRLRAAAQNQEPGPVVQATQVPQPETVQLEDEKAQRELDLRTVNQQLLGARQALSAAKVNRLLNAAGLLADDAKQHDRKFREEIHDIREGIELMKATKASMGEHGIEEPALIGIEVPGPEGIASLAK